MSRLHRRNKSKNEETVGCMKIILSTMALGNTGCMFSCKFLTRNKKWFHIREEYVSHYSRNIVFADGRSNKTHGLIKRMEKYNS